MVMSRPCPTLVVGNVKGGVGKSTTAVQLALHAGERGLRVLLIDADPGRTALSWVARAEEWPHDRVPAIAHNTPDLPRRLPGLAEGFDLVVIDTPHDPSNGTEVGPMLASALAAADLVIVPTAPDPLEIDRLVDMVAAIAAEQNRRDIDWCLALVRVDLRCQDHVEAREALVAQGIPVLLDVVPQRKAIRRAFGSAVVLPWYAPMADAVLDHVLVGA